MAWLVWWAWLGGKLSESMSSYSWWVITAPLWIAGAATALAGWWLIREFLRVFAFCEKVAGNVRQTARNLLKRIFPSR